MHTADRKSAARSLRSIALLATEQAKALEKDTDALGRDHVYLAEAISLIEAHLEKIEKLEIFSTQS